ncbi:MAG: TlpA family protein disulfide reductase [Phycisphaerae bacterium]|nr:TlpA family protein disulfide reductase [Phycisphaerae bacterium]
MFGGTWCPWCIREAPSIAKLYAKYHHHGLEVVGVSLNGTTAAVHRYRMANPQENWPQLQDSHHSNEAIAQRLGIQGLPSELVIDRHGVLKHTLVGYAPRQLAADVRKLLPPAKPAH